MDGKSSIMMCKLNGWMNKDGHYMEINGWMEKVVL